MIDMVEGLSCSKSGHPVVSVPETGQNTGTAFSPEMSGLDPAVLRRCYKENRRMLQLLCFNLNLLRAEESVRHILLWSFACKGSK